MIDGTSQRRLLWTGLTACLALAALALVLVALFRGGDDEPPAALHPTATATATATALTAPTAPISPTPFPPPTYTPTLPVLANHPPDTRTGIANVDPVLDALIQGSADAIEPLIEYVSVPCVEGRTANRHPLQCREGMQPGDVLIGLWFYDVEGGLSPPDRAASHLVSLLSGRLYGVFRYVEPESGLPPREYGIVFLYVAAPQYEFVSVDVRDGRIVSVDFVPPEEVMLNPDHPRWILPPVAVPPRG